MKITKVFRTDDGEIFDTKKEAEEYVAEEQRLDEIMKYLKDSFVGVSEEGCREILFVLGEGYEIVPKYD